MRYLSLFSGVEAASLAFEPLGWTPVAFAEIDPFASAVLAHHWPQVPNLGDVTKIDGTKLRGQVDLVSFGWPCQDVSIAGLRKGLHDEEGKQTRSGLLYDAMRVVRECGARWFIAENVPGLLSSKGGRDFAAVLSEITGLAITPPSRGWQCTGVAAAEGRDQWSVAWSVLDAQWFGIPQRRNRIFFAGYLGDWRPAVQVLLEPESLRGDSPPSRRKGQVAAALTASSLGGGGPDDNTARGGHLVDAGGRDERDGVGRDGTGSGGDGDGGTVGTLGGTSPGGGWRVGADEAAAGQLVVGPVMSHYGTGGIAPDEAASNQLVIAGANNWEGEVARPLLAKAGARGDLESETFVAHTLRGSGFDASEDGTGRGTPLVAVPIAFSSKDHGADASVDLSPTLRAGGFVDSHANGGVPPAVMIAGDERDLPCSPCEAGLTPLTGDDVADPVTASEGKTYTHEGKHNFRLHNVVAMALQEVDCPREAPKNGIGIGDANDPMFTLQAAHQHGVAVSEEPEVFQCHGSNIGPMGTLRAGNGALTGGVPFLAVPTEAESVPFIVNAAASTAKESHAREVETARCLDRTGGFAAGQGGTVVAVALRGREGGATAELGDDQSNALRASQGGGDKPYIMFDQAQITHPENRANPQPGDPAPTVAKNSQLRVAGTSGPAMRIRRLLPVECERLMGMPDDHTLIPYPPPPPEFVEEWRAVGPNADIRKVKVKVAADGPRYQAIGNSWAVPCARWIGERVDMVEALLAKGVWQP